MKKSNIQNAKGSGRCLQRFVRPIPRDIESNPVGIEIGLKTGNVRLGYFKHIKNPISFCRLSTPKKFTLQKKGAWQFRVWRFALAYRPNDPKLSHGANNRKCGFVTKYKIKEQPPLAPARC